MLGLFFHVTYGGEYQCDDEADEDVGCECNEIGSFKNSV